MQVIGGQTYFIFESHINSITCKIFSWLINVLTLASSWILVGVSTERMLAVQFPHRIRTWRSTKKTLLYVLLVYIGSMLMSSFELFLLEHDDKACEHTPSSLAVVHPAIHFILQTILPFFIIVVCNAIIVFNAVVSSREIQPNRSNQRSNYSLTGLSSTVIALSFMFILLRAPLHIYGYWQEYFLHIDFYSEQGMKNVVKNTVLHNITRTLDDLNYAIGFYLYLLTGRSFREQVGDTFEKVLFWQSKN